MRPFLVLLFSLLASPAWADDQLSDATFCGPYTDQDGNVAMTTVCRDASVPDSTVAEAIRKFDEHWRRCVALHKELEEKKARLTESEWIKSLTVIGTECRQSGVTE